MNKIKKWWEVVPATLGVLGILWMLSLVIPIAALIFRLLFYAAVILLAVGILWAITGVVSKYRYHIAAFLLIGGIIAALLWAGSLRIRLSLQEVRHQQQVSTMQSELEATLRVIDTLKGEPGAGRKILDDIQASRNAAWIYIILFVAGAILGLAIKVFGWKKPWSIFGGFIAAGCTCIGTISGIQSFVLRTQVITAIYPLSKVDQAVMMVHFGLLAEMISKISAAGFALGNLIVALFEIGFGFVSTKAER